MTLFQCYTLVDTYNITFFSFSIEILAALGVETLEEVVQIINQMERESIQEVEENTNENISLVEGVNF